MAHRIRKLQLTIVCNATNNTVPATAPTAKLNGILRGVKIKTPGIVDTSATTAVTIADSDGDNVYSKSGIAANTTSVEYEDTNHTEHSEPLGDTYTITPTLSANQTVARTVIVTIYYESFQNIL